LLKRLLVGVQSSATGPSTDGSLWPILRLVTRPTGCTDLAVLVNGFPRLSETFVLH